MKLSNNSIDVDGPLFTNKTDLNHSGLFYIKNGPTNLTLFIVGYERPSIGQLYSAVLINSGKFLYRDLRYENLIKTLQDNGYYPLGNNSIIMIKTNNFLKEDELQANSSWAQSKAGKLFIELLNYLNNNQECAINIAAVDCGINYGVIRKWLNGGNPSMTFLTRVVNAINNRLNNPESTRISHEIIEETKRYKNDQRKQKV